MKEKIEACAQASIPLKHGTLLVIRGATPQKRELHHKNHL
jgi:hypothetical protein